jgi:hypothetical protein
MSKAKSERAKTATARYWRRRVIAEQQQEETMKRTVLLDGNAPVSATTWRVKRQLAIGGKVFPAGSHVADSELGRNRDALIGSGAVAPAADGAVAVAQPRELPSAPPPAPKGKPVVTIVHDNDALESWHLTKAAMTRLLDGDAARAEDILFTDPTARRLYQTATQIACEREKERLGKMGIARRSVSPSELVRPL